MERNDRICSGAFLRRKDFMAAGPRNHPEHRIDGDLPGFLRRENCMTAQDAQRGIAHQKKCFFGHVIHIRNRPGGDHAQGQTFACPQGCRISVLEQRVILLRKDRYPCYPVFTSPDRRCQFARASGSQKAGKHTENYSCECRPALPARTGETEKWRCWHLEIHVASSTHCHQQVKPLRHSLTKLHGRSKRWN